MKQLAFNFVSRVGTLLSHRQRRFLLDRLGLGRLFDRMARGGFGEVALPDGSLIAFNQLLHAHMIRNGELVYEAHVLQAMRDNLEPGGGFYDVGANIGVFAFTAAGQVGPAGAVHAFEPEENNLTCFRRSLEKSGLNNIVLHEMAVGAMDGSMTFDRRGGAFSGRLVEGNAGVKGASVDVQVRAIDNVVAEGAPPPTLVKIDVEGGEGAVLEGMRQTLKDHGPTILCELHSFNPIGVRRVFEVLSEVGYVCEALDGSRLAIADLQSGALADAPAHILAKRA